MGQVERPLIRERAGLWVSAVLLMLLAIHEVDEVIGRLLDATRGRAYTPTGLTGLATVRSLTPPWTSAKPFVEGWDFLDGADAVEGRLPAWLLVYAGLDVVFIALYGWALWRAARAVDRSRRTPVLVFLGVGVAADLAESLLVAMLPYGGADQVKAWALLIVSSVKWVGLVVAVVLLIRAHWGWLAGTAWPQAKLAVRGLYTHRYSLLIVLPLALMGLAHGHDILEQVPDIQRRWIDGDEWSGVWSGLLTVVLVVATLLIDRLRIDDLIRRQGAAPATGQHLGLWYASAVVLAVVGLIAWQVGSIRVWALLVFAAVPAGIAVASSVIARFGRQGRPPPLDPPDDERVRTAWLVGDLLPIALVVVAGAGLVRSVTGVLLLDAGVLLGWLAVLGGLALALAAWPGYGWALERLDRARAEPGARPTGRLASLSDYVVTLFRPGQGDEGSPWVAPAILVVGVCGYVAVGLYPDLFGALGVLAAFQIALGSLAIAVSAAVTVNRRAGVPYVFWRLRVKFVPITVLLLVTAIVCAGLPGEIHPIRRIDAAAEPRLGFEKAFAAWLTATEGCEVEVGDVSIRPMFLYAAEGGGIRAAYWTAAAVDTIASVDGVASNCARAFLSSGASGGSVGLTVASVAPPGGATDQVRKIADQSALSAAVLGLVARDQIFAATGIGLPLAGDADWVDRAGLIERSWSESITGLTAPFFQPAPPSSPVGSLVLNSTASNGCRALLSQIDLGPATSPGSCEGRGVLVAASIDMHECTGQISAATAALLSARFPYVTPAGEAECGDHDLKFVDGGYAENTGIVTQVDLVHEWLPMVRRHNQTAGSTGTVVVPILVYFDNGTGSDLRADAGAPPIEVLIPPLTKGAATATLTSPESNLQRAAALLGLDQLGLDGNVAKVVEGWRPYATAVVYAASSPSIAAPLGWVLSPHAMDAMDDAIADAPRPLPGHASLGDVLQMLDP